jgi:hypothetical protein
MKTSCILILTLLVCSSPFTEAANRKVAFNIGDDFSLASNPRGPWAHGVINTSGFFVPFVEPLQVPDDNGLLVELWRDPFSGSAIFHNQNDVDAISNGGEGVHAPNSVWFHPPLGFDERWAAVRFTVPLTGRYSLEAAFTKILHTVGNNVELRIEHNGVVLFSDILGPSEPPSTFRGRFAVEAGDVIDFLIGDTGDGSFGDATVFDITLTGSERVPNGNVFNIGDDFSMLSNPHEAWAYGGISNDGTFTPFSTPFSSPDDNGVMVDLWYEPSTGSAIFHNQNDITVISNGGEGVHPPNSVWFHPPLGVDERWAAVRFVVPQQGRYSIAATFTKVLHTLGNDVELRIQRNGDDLFSDILSAGEAPLAYTATERLEEGDVIYFLIGDTGDGTFGDATVFDITLRRGPDRGNSN